MHSAINNTADCTIDRIDYLAYFFVAYVSVGLRQAVRQLISILPQSFMLIGIDRQPAGHKRIKKHFQLIAKLAVAGNIAKLMFVFAKAVTYHRD